MATDKAEGPEKADKDLSATGADSAAQADEALDNVVASDEGYTPYSESPAQDEPVADESVAEESAEVDVPSGEELAEEDLHDPAPFEIVDDEAEELAEEGSDDGSSILALFRGIDDQDEPRIDDREQLDDATEEAAEAKSTRPTRRQRPVKKATEEPTATVESVVEEAPVTTGANAGAKKNRPTRTRAEATAADAPKKTGPVDFIGQIVQELKKVIWPTGSQLLRYFLVVLVFVLFMITFIGLLDLLFGWLTLKLFGS